MEKSANFHTPMVLTGVYTHTHSRACVRHFICYYYIIILSFVKFMSFRWLIILLLLLLLYNSRQSIVDLKLNPFSASFRSFLS